ncbi:MAG TPA: nuclear transport factor 2 family protein [Thermoleophilaceae bacterium]
MSQENVDLVRAAMFRDPVDLVELSHSGEFQRAIDPSAFAPDVVVVFMTPSGPPTEYSGIAGMGAGWRDWLAPWASYQVVVDEMRDAGDRVVALATLRGDTLRDGVHVEQPGAAVVTIRDGKIARVEFHLDRREALESAGLSA